MKEFSRYLKTYWPQDLAASSNQTTAAIGLSEIAAAKGFRDVPARQVSRSPWEERAELVYDLVQQQPGVRSP
jgi:hypothetical protein